MTDNLTEKEFEIMQGYDESIVEYYRDIESHNKSILELVGSEYGPKILKKVEKFFKSEGEDCIIGKMKIVDKCYGDKNKGGGFGFYYVDQRRPEGRKECLQCGAAKPYGETSWVTKEMENNPCFTTKEQIRLFCEESREERLLRMKSEEKIDKIARLCHEVNRIYCKSIGDFSHKSWEETPEELQNSVKAGVVNNLLKDLNPRQSHEEWVKYRSERGWVYGKEKDLEKKTHPCMVDYEDLPPEQKTKDEFFNFICSMFKDDGNI